LTGKLYRQHVYWVKLIRLLRYILLLSLLASIEDTLAQGKGRPAELGKADLSWWLDTINSGDTTAAAIILFDYGQCSANPYSGTKLIHSRRIKILKKSALEDWANLSFLGLGIRLADFDCTVYNLENNQIITSVIDKTSIMKRQFVQGVKMSAVAIPNVREGSVIEYTYTLKSYSYALPSWDFQYSIPVVWSEYDFSVSGNRSGITAMINGLYPLSDLIKDKNRGRTYIMKDIPAFRAEPSMPSHRFFKSSIQFNTKFGIEMEEEYRKDRLMKYGITRDSAKLDTKIAATINFTVTESAELNGKLVMKKSGYEAIKARKEIKKSSVDEYLKNELSPNWTITSKELLSKVDTLKADTLKELVSQYEFLIHDQVQVADQFLYVNPYVVLSDISDPFRLEKRVYPLDLGSRMVRITTTIIEIPNGYKLEELPRSTSVVLPGKDASFSINSSVIGKSVYVTSYFKNNKILFSTMEYGAVRDFFSRMVAKQSEPIVFKKE
jgi:hypothetical protein